MTFKTLISSNKTNSSDANAILRSPVIGIIQGNQVPVLIKGTQTGLIRIEYHEVGDTTISYSEWGRLSFTDDLSISLILTDIGFNKIFEYRIQFGDSTFSSSYQFSTFPTSANSGEFSFVFSACLRDNYTPHDIFDYIKPLSPTFIALLGDNIYADKDGDINAGPAHSVLPALRSKYTRNFDEHFQEIGSSFPIIAIWDDHDYGQDNSDSTYVYKTEAKKVFKENFPIYPFAVEEAGIYYRFSVADVDFFVLDTRWYRSPMQEDDIEGKTMLGNEQLAWLLDGLKRSTAVFKIIFSSVPLNDYGGDTSSGRDGFDSWMGYKFERDSIMSYIEENNIQGVLVFSGDQHYPSAHILNWKSPLTYISKTDSSIIYSLQELGTAVFDFSASPLHYTRATGHSLITANQDNPLFSYEIFRANWAHPGNSSPGLTSVYGLAKIDTKSSNPSISVIFYELDITNTNMEELYRITINLTSLTTTTLSTDNSPEEYLLAENYPNPFNTSTTLAYRIKELSTVTLVIYNLMSQEVYRWNRGTAKPGYYEIIWDGKDELGNSVPSGIYFYRLEASPTSVWQAGDFVRTRKMVLLK